MKLEYVPLLQVQRDIHDMPRNYDRFKHYLRTIFQSDELGMRAPILAMNPMGKEHVANLLDQYLALDADAIGARAAAAVEPELEDLPGTFKITLVIADDLMGGWTNRYANEFEYRFGRDRRKSGGNNGPKLPRWLNHFWLMGVLWTSEPVSERNVTEAILTAAHRAAYTHQNGPAPTLRAMLAQEGHVMVKAGCTTPVLDPEDLEYTREVLVPYLDANDNRTCIECLFGDEPGRTLGFTPRGLSPWAGLALALHDARVNSNNQLANSKTLPPL